MSNLPAIPPTKKPQLYRGHEDAKVGGVCAALGHRFGIDPVWLRVAFLAAVLGWGIGLLPYVILWIAIPDIEPPRKALPVAPPMPADPDEVPQELVEAWKEVNDITEN